jgi:hypothetical protein
MTRSKIFCRRIGSFLSVVDIKDFYHNGLTQLKNLKMSSGWMWWCMLFIPALGRLKPEDLEFKVSLG